jgi:peptidoglycan hydrolase CwlO-like protein
LPNIEHINYTHVVVHMTHKTSMSKRDVAEVKSNEGLSIQSLLLEKHDLQKHISELDKEIQELQGRNNRR